MKSFIEHLNEGRKERGFSQDDSDGYVTNFESLISASMNRGMTGNMRTFVDISKIITTNTKSDEEALKLRKRLIKKAKDVDVDSILQDTKDKLSSINIKLGKDLEKLEISMRKNVTKLITKYDKEITSIIKNTLK